MSLKLESAHRTTGPVGKIFLTSMALSSPLEAIYTLLIFIAAKELHASALQLTLLACCKSISSLLAFLLNSTYVSGLKSYKRFMVCASICAALPVFAFPFMESPWYYILAYLIFISSQQAQFPAWMTILKGVSSKERLSQLQGTAISIQNSIFIFLPLTLGFLLDYQLLTWKLAFVFLAGVHLVSSFVLNKMPMSLTQAYQMQEDVKNPLRFSLKNSYNNYRILLQQRPDYMHYLFLFFLGGVGLVMIQPALPLFYKEQLNLSYTNLTLAFGFFRGVALVASAKWWVTLTERMSLYLLHFWINTLSALFLLLLLIANWNTYWLFVAYLVYGAMQSGCELSMHLSGPIFSKDKHCLQFSNLILAAIGLRGLTTPFIGQALLFHTDFNSLFFIAGLLCMVSAFYALKLEKEFEQPCAHQSLYLL